LVALDEDSKTAFFGECKWCNKQVGVNVYEDLIRKSNQVEWKLDSRKNRFILFSKSGFTEAMFDRANRENVLLVHKDRLLGG